MIDFILDCIEGKFHVDKQTVVTFFVSDLLTTAVSLTIFDWEHELLTMGLKIVLVLFTGLVGGIFSTFGKALFDNYIKPKWFKEWK